MRLPRQSWPRAKAAVVTLAIAMIHGVSASTPQAPPSPPRPVPPLVATSMPACADFYQYACGPWLAQHPLPPTESWWTPFHEIIDRNFGVLHAILEGPSTADETADPDLPQLRTFYASCIGGADKQPLDTLRASLARARGLQNLDALMPLLAALHVEGVPGLFVVSVAPGSRDATRYVLYASLGGLGLPSVSLYTRPDTTILEKYRDHIARMFTLTGREAAVSRAAADAILAFETRIAALIPTAAERRAIGSGTPLTARQWSKQSGLDLEGYLRTLGLNGVTTEVTLPASFSSLADVLVDTKLETIRSFLEWQIIRDAAPMLPDRFADEAFAFYGLTLNGIQRRQERPRRCVQATGAAMPDTLGRFFVGRTLSPVAVAKAESTITALVDTLAEQIAATTWMAQSTRAHALEKLRSTKRRVAKPARWRPSPRAALDRDDFLGNSWRLQSLARRARLARVGGRVDRDEWTEPVWIADAYADATRNVVTLPAGILQPPVFDAARSDAENFGTVGAFMGHEFIHLFDDGGRHYDAEGNRRDWWTPDDVRAFQQRSACLVDQYSNYEVIDGRRIDGRLTLGENMSDLGGLRIALLAWSRRHASDLPDDPLTSRQRFFLAYAQMWCSVESSERTKLRLQTDRHSPNRFRVNGVLSNMPQFAEAFSCRPDDQMVRELACRIW